MQALKKDYLDNVDQLLLEHLEMRLIAKGFREQNDDLTIQLEELRRVLNTM